MHTRIPLLAATLLTCAPAPILGQEMPTPGPLHAIRWTGGSADDRLLAGLALGFPEGSRPGPGDLELGLAAIRITDRFREVHGTAASEAGGVAWHITLRPWPAASEVTWEGLPPGFDRWLPPDLRKGAILGDARLAQYAELLQARLREFGYPAALVTPRREREDRRIVFSVRPGAARAIRSVRVEGGLRSDEVLRICRLVPGQTLWTEVTRQDLLLRLRRHFLKANRMEGHADLLWEDPTGTLKVLVHPGPIIQLAHEGSGLGLSRLKNLTPLARAERYSPDLLEEGERKLTRMLMGKGYLDAKVTHRREILRGSAESPELVRITYVLQPGQRRDLVGYRLEGCREVEEADLQREVTIPKAWVLFGRPNATPDLIGLLRDLIESAYRRRGFPDAKLIPLPGDLAGDTVTAVFRVREGARRTVGSLVLDLPAASFPAPWPLAHALSAYLTEKPSAPPSAVGPWTLAADLADRQDVTGRLEEVPPPAPGIRRFRLRFSRDLPFTRTDHARVLQALQAWRQGRGYPSQGEAAVQWEETEGTAIRFTLPPQSPSIARRLVVIGADQTSGEAVRRANQLLPGTPLSPERAIQTQSDVASLGGMQRVDVYPLSEEFAQPTEWAPGDMALRIQERSPWVVHHSFGYESSQGYHLGTGIQRTNLWGMGRTLDFGIRAGDGTLQNPTLRKLFPTGEHPRSVDMYSLAYSDPWLSPGFLRGWIPDRTQFRSEAAFLEERKDTYLIRKRRWQNSLEWRPTTIGTLQVGWRYEKVRVLSAIEGISDDELNSVVRMRSQATISAPYAQYSIDRRDNPYDPLEGSVFSARMEFANQLFGTTANTSFVKLDLRQQWHWPMGFHARYGVLSLGLRLGAAVPTAESARDLPLSERFFAGGPFTHRGVEPDWLGPQGTVPLRQPFPPYDPQLDPAGNPKTQAVPLGGQGLALLNAEYRFPLWGRMVWGEVFLDSGTIYRTFFPEPSESRRPHVRTALGLGLIAKLGIPIKLEYGWDIRRILGRTPSMSLEDQRTQLHSVLISAGFQF